MASRIDVANAVSMGVELWAPLLKPDELQSDPLLAYGYLRALIIEGIGERRCPLVPKWAAFVVGGAVIASRTGCFITPPEPRPADFSAHLNRYLWQAVYEAIADGESDPFLSAMAGFFVPIRHYPAPDPPYFESTFEEYWAELRYEACASVGQLSGRMLSEREKVFAKIGIRAAEEVVRVAQYVPVMIDIALSEMEGQYLY